MSVTQATLKIRTFHLDIVDLAFAEDDFNLLSDELKAELAARRAVLLAASRPKEAGFPAWLLWAFGIGLLIFAINIMNAPQDAPEPSRRPEIEQQQ